MERIWIIDQIFDGHKRLLVLLNTIPGCTATLKDEGIEVRCLEVSENEMEAACERLGVTIGKFEVLAQEIKPVLNPVKEIREALNMSQEVLAAEIGVSEEEIARCERESVLPASDEAKDKLIDVKLRPLQK